MYKQRKFNLARIIIIVVSVMMCVLSYTGLWTTDNIGLAILWLIIAISVI